MTNSGDETVTVLNTGTFAPVGAPIPVGKEPDGVAISPDGGTAFVAQRGGEISIIDTNTAQVVGTIDDSFGPSRITIGPDGDRAFVTNHLADTVTAFNPASHNLIGTPIPVGNEPTGHRDPSRRLLRLRRQRGRRNPDPDRHLDRPAGRGAARLPRRDRGRVRAGRPPRLRHRWRRVDRLTPRHQAQRRLRGDHRRQQTGRGRGRPRPGAERFVLGLADLAAGQETADLPRQQLDRPRRDDRRLHLGLRRSRARRRCRSRPAPTATGGGGPIYVTLKVTDNEGCSTKTVFTGQTVSCQGNPLASITVPLKVLNEAGPKLQVSRPRPAGDAEGRRPRSLPAGRLLVAGRRHRRHLGRRIRPQGPASAPARRRPRLRPRPAAGGGWSCASPARPGGAPNGRCSPAARPRPGSPSTPAIARTKSRSRPRSSSSASEARGRC